MMSYTDPPTYEQLRDLWMDNVPSAGPSEKFDREQNFQRWAARYGLTTGGLTMAYTSEFPIIDVTVDAVVFFASHSPAEGPLEVLLIRRGQEPHKGAYALPGGFLDVREDAATSALRELREETGLVVPMGADIRPLSPRTHPHRDPRKRIISLPFLIVVHKREKAQLVAGDDAAAVEVLPVGDVIRDNALAFDHNQIVAEAMSTFMERSSLYI